MLDNLVDRGKMREKRSGKLVDNVVIFSAVIALQSNRPKENSATVYFFFYLHKRGCPDVLRRFKSFAVRLSIAYGKKT